MPNTENQYTATDLGNVAPNPRGAYTETASYEYLDTVSYKGGSYMCIAELGATGVSPVHGENTDTWQMLTLPGELTPEYIAAHDDVVAKAKQVEASRAAVELSQQEVEAAQVDVQQLHEDTRTAAREAEASRDSASGSAQAAEASRTAAKESEDNVHALTTGFDERVAEETEKAKAAVAEARLQAVNVVESQKDISIQAVKDQTAEYISQKETEAKNAITKHTDSEIERADTALSRIKKQIDSSADAADEKNTILQKTIQDAIDLNADIGTTIKEAKEATTQATAAAKSAADATEAAEKAAETANKQADVAKNAAEDLKSQARRFTDILYKEKVAAAASKEKVDELFVEWWKAQYDPELFSKSDMLERWFGNVLEDSRVHGVTTPRYSKSTSMIGELTDDSAGLTCTPSTAEIAGNDPFAHLPQFWCLEVAAEKNLDGSHTIYYVEHIDNTADVRSGEHLCWVLQKNTYKREWQDKDYKYLKTRCTPAPGYKRWKEGTDKTGKVHEYMAHPKYYAGIDANGRITCGTGLRPVNRTSHATGVNKWRARGTQYSGASGTLPKFLETMTRLKYGRKGNSGKIEGCTNYNYQYTVAVSETGVERVILTTAQAANLLVGSAVMLGIQSGSDRNTASNYSIFDAKLITAIEKVTIDDTEYSAVYVDNGGKTFDTTAGSTYLSTSPYYSGWNDEVLGRDGCRHGSTSGKEPGMIQGVEFMNGSYLIVSDELWQWGTDADGNYTFDCFKCYEQSKVGSAINDNYEQIQGAHLVYPAGTTGGWKYITDNIIDDDVLWPEGTDASGSGVGVGAGFLCSPAASGVRAAWCFGILSSGGIASVSCHRSDFSVGAAAWNGSLGAPGLEG